MNRYKPDFKKFFIRYLLKRLALIALIFFLCYLWLNLFFSVIVGFAIIGYFYEAWLSEKEKYNQYLFLNDIPPKAQGITFWIASFIELLILLVGLHYLYKGFTVVTGISEAWFNINTTGKLAAVLTSVSFIMAMAIMLTMMLILYQITNSPKNNRLIMAYVLIDIIILMPFNFMFSYENNQKENLVIFYAKSLPKLHDKIGKELNKLKEQSDNKYDSVSVYNYSIRKQIEELEEQRRAENERYADKDQSQMDKDARSSWLTAHNAELRRINTKINTLTGRLDPREIAIKINKGHYDTIYYAFAQTSSIVRGIVNGKIEKEKLYDSVFFAKQIFNRLAEADTIFKNDSVASYYIQCLQVSPEAPIDGFSNLMNDLVGWALKEKFTNPGGNDRNATAAQKNWNATLPQKRWFSFLFSVSIDLIPLVVALCYMYFFKQRSKFIHEE